MFVYRMDRRRALSVWLFTGKTNSDDDYERCVASFTVSDDAAPVVILATSSSVVRGIATAINWLRPPPYELRVTSTFEEALTIAQKQRGGEPLTTLQVLLDEARAEAAKAI